MVTAALESSLVQWWVTISARRRNKRFADNWIQQVDRFGEGSVMMWAAISYTGRTNLIQVQGSLSGQRYCEIIHPDDLPIMQRNDVRFQQDNARPHAARLKTAIFKSRNIALLLLPSKSPYLNPNENLSYELDRRLSQRPQPQTWPQLFLVPQAEWDNIHPTDNSNPDLIDWDTLAGCYWCSWRKH